MFTNANEVVLLYLADMLTNTLKANLNSFFTVWFQIQKEFITPSTIAEQMPSLVLCLQENVISIQSFERQNCNCWQQ